MQLHYACVLIHTVIYSDTGDLYYNHISISYSFLRLSITVIYATEYSVQSRHNQCENYIWCKPLYV